MIRINKRFLFLCFLAFAFAYLSGGNLPYCIFYIFLFILLTGIIYMIVCKRALGGKMKINNKIYSVGDSDEFNIMIENDSIIPLPYVIVTNNIFKEFIEKYKGNIVFIGADKNKWIKNKVTFNKRGIYDFGRIAIELNDLFYVFRYKKILKDKLYINVYPKIYNLKDLQLRGNDSYENIINSKSGIDDLALIKDIRQYRMGDSLKKVHWKLSAKHGELYVKNFDSISGKEFNLFINMTKENINIDKSGIAEEEMIDYSASLIKYMMLNSIKTKVFLNAEESKKLNIENKDDFNGIMEYFLTNISGGADDFSQYIKSNLKHISRRSFIGIISINVDYSLKETVMNLMDLGYKVNVFYSNSHIGELENIILLNNIGVKCVNYKEIINGNHN